MCAKCLIYISIWLLILLSPTHAVTPDEILEDPILEERARDLSAKLRCLVCQNQSIDDSDAPLAKDLRVLVRQQLLSGSSDAEVLDFVVSKYGEFVLLQPKFANHTLILWFLPPFIFIVGLLTVIILFRLPQKNLQVAVEPNLSEEEAKRLKQILEHDSPNV